MNYEFNYEVQGTNYKMVFTSVLGHMMNLSYPEELSDWQKTPFDLLYTTPLNTKINDSQKHVAKNLLNNSSNIDLLILWLD